MASATLRIRLLGQLDLRQDEVAVPPLGSARAESLLAYLLLHREAPQPRQRLAFLLWPDSTEPQARTNLRHLLHNLRRALPDPDRFLEVTQRTLRWRDDALAASGVGHVVALSTVAAGQPGATGPAAGLRELEQRLSGLGDRNLLVLRSPFYMENLLAALPLIQAKGVNASAVDGDLELPMIATRDVAAEAAERLARRDFSGHQVKLLVGPEDVSLRAATRALGERLGLPEVGYVQLPPADVQGALMSFGMAEAPASAMVELQLGLNRHGSFATVRDAADTTTPTRLADFLEAATR
jgi:uncharacterized protein YbjT (DUF2867 family)